MTHPIYRVKAFEHVGPYTVRIVFDDHTEQVVDFRPVLAGELYGPLRDPVVFLQARLDAEAGTLTWPNGADFDPSTLRHWQEHLPGFLEAAERWKQSEAAVQS